jgi:hypothetical protein
MPSIQTYDKPQLEERIRAIISGVVEDAKWDDEKSKEYIRVIQSRVYELVKKVSFFIARLNFNSWA